MLLNTVLLYESIAGMSPAEDTSGTPQTTTERERMFAWLICNGSTYLYFLYANFNSLKQKGSIPLQVLVASHTLRDDPTRLYPSCVQEYIAVLPYTVSVKLTVRPPVDPGITYN